MKNNFGKVFDFKAQMAIGNKGEQDFLTQYKSLGPVKSEDDKTFDFRLGNGKKVELKSDSYSMEETENFFMEVCGCITTAKLGGPLRAKQDKVDYFVYYFPRNKTFFWFRTDELCERLELIILTKKYKAKDIKNKGWTAIGYAIPRSEFADLEMKQDKF